MRIAFVVNQVAGGWSPLAPDAWGGGEEVATLLTAALARRGHEVACIYDGEAIEANGVTFLPRTAEQERYAFDATIYFKCPEYAGLKLARRQFLLSDQERWFDPDPFLRIVPCSDYLRRFYASLVPRSEEKLTVIPYGYERGELRERAPADGWWNYAREPNLVLHASSPDRGLEPFLTYWPAVLDRHPVARLLIAYGWDLYDRCGGDPRLKLRIQNALEVLPAGSWEMRRLSRAEMHAAFYRAGVWAYYCTGGEQFCLTAIKAQYAGCVPVVKPWGAMRETIKTGLLVETPDAFIAALNRALDPEEQERLRGTVNADHASTWDQVAEKWDALLQETEERAPTSHARIIPDAPPFGKASGWNAQPILANALPQWLGAIQAKRPWIDPALEVGRGAAETPDTADAVVLGWAIEDAAASPRETLQALGIVPGTPVMVVSSFGTWRAGLRRRALSRRDLLELFGQQPEALMNSAPIEGIGCGFFMTTFRILPDRIGERDLGRVRAHSAPRQTMAVCYIARDSTTCIGGSLDSIRPIVDQVVCVDTGSTDHTRELVEEWGRKAGIPTIVQPGTSPRWCFTCLREHDIGEMYHGHYAAGFETPRNQSIALAETDWILWLDSDEKLKHPERLTKYLRPNMFVGYGLQQHHHSMEPPEARKVDFPVRLFRRTPLAGSPVGWYEADGWPSYGTGLASRFTGLVHEHPGNAPTYTEGMGPVVILSDIGISHDGYLTEEIRRGRFRRNWPLMVADRQKYPGRRLGRFLWLRDLTHQARYLIEVAGNRLTPEAATLAQEAIRVWEENFLDRCDAYSPEAMSYAAVAYAMLGRGMEATVSIKVKRPEVTGDEMISVDFGGRFEQVAHILKAAEARLVETSRWSGRYL